MAMMFNVSENPAIRMTTLNTKNVCTVPEYIHMVVVSVSVWECVGGLSTKLINGMHIRAQHTNL